MGYHGSEVISSDTISKISRDGKGLRMNLGGKTVDLLLQLLRKKAHASRLVNALKEEQ